MKRIKYLWGVIDVPGWAKWVVTDQDGKIFAFENKPSKSEVFNGWVSADSEPYHIVGHVQLPFERDWENSLQEVDPVTIEVVVDEPIAPHVELEDSPMHTQVGGSHYKDMAIQPVEFIHKNGIGYMEGNVIKYVARWRGKNGLEDLKKARHYIDLLIDMESGK